MDRFQPSLDKPTAAAGAAATSRADAHHCIVRKRVVVLSVDAQGLHTPYCIIITMMMMMIQNDGAAWFLLILLRRRRRRRRRRQMKRERERTAE